MAARRAAAKRESEVVDLRSCVVSLLPAAVGTNGYTDIDRYRDMNAVFTRGDSTQEQRERVLFQLLDACLINRPLAAMADVEGGDRKIWLAAGRQQVGLTLLDWLTKEPKSG